MLAPLFLLLISQAWYDLASLIIKAIKKLYLQSMNDNRGRFN